MDSKEIDSLIEKYEHKKLVLLNAVYFTEELEKMMLSKPDSHDKLQFGLMKNLLESQRHNVDLTKMVIDMLKYQKEIL